jgi:hypothetical protein
MTTLPVHGDAEHGADVRGLGRVLVPRGARDDALRPGRRVHAAPLELPGGEGRKLDTTNNNTDWTKTTQSHTSLVHDTGLTNGNPVKRHAALPALGSTPFTRVTPPSSVEPPMAHRWSRITADEDTSA